MAGSRSPRHRALLASFVLATCGALVSSCSSAGGGGDTAPIDTLPTTPEIAALPYATAGQAGYTATVPAQAGVTFTWTITGGTIHRG